MSGCPMNAPLSRPIPRLAIDRSSDRRVALVAIVAAIAFLAAAMVAIVLPDSGRLGAWLPLHLALAGAATTAIAGVMPFFTAAFAAAPPSDVRLRIAAVGTVALGAGGVAVVEVGLGGRPVALMLTASATIRPLGRALGPSRGLVIQGYLAALAEVVLGASIATLFVAGWPAIVSNWDMIKPAHAWLNLVGFVSLLLMFVALLASTAAAFGTDAQRMAAVTRSLQTALGESRWSAAVARGRQRSRR